jgi:hypothetical protein
LGGVALAGGEAADRGVDGVDVDQGRVEDRSAIDHLGDRGGRSSGGAAALGLEGDGIDAAILNSEGDPREVSASSPARGARESAVRNRPTPALVGQVVLVELPFHGFKGKAHRPPGAPIA